MAGQNPFVYQPHPAGAHAMDPREGWFRRKFRTGDIELPPDPGGMVNAPDGGMPVPPSATSILRPGGPEAPRIPPPAELDAQQPQSQGNYALMGGGSPEQTRGALAGLQSAQGDQYSPFSEFELSRLANRDVNMVAPGSNQVWQNKLSQLQNRRAESEKADYANQRLIDTAMAGLHPGVQEAALNRAQNEALPSIVNARMARDTAQIRANAQLGAANAMASSRYQGDQLGHLDQVMQAIRNIKAKTTQSPGDAAALKALMSLYDQLATGLTGATFEDSGSPEE